MSNTEDLEPIDGIDAVIRIAKRQQPDLWARTEAIARIIDPSAFETNWVIHPEESARLHRARLQVLQWQAIGKAQEVLRFLGVNTDADWFSILSELGRKADV